MNYKNKIALCKKQSESFNREIDKIGYRKFINDFKKIIKSHNVENIKRSFDDFKKDINDYPLSVNKISNYQKELINLSRTNS